MSSPEHNPEFEALLDYVKRSRGFDFTGYKRTSLMRRVRKRMQTCDITTYSDYLDYLEVHPEEFRLLFNTLLINVTAFFRDRPAWDYLSHEILPRLLAQSSGPIRVWSAGCASGQEAYTIAMVLAELMGIEPFRERVKIYATDVDEEALNQGRLATYLAQEIASVPPELMEKYFEQNDNRFTFRQDLRRAVIFGRHDLIQDAPISKLDLLVCRNTLMYFNAETQTRILARFHFALRDRGCLFLGKAEMLLTHTNMFTPLDLKRRIFTKVSKPHLRDRLLILSQCGHEEPEHEENDLANQGRLRETAFDCGPLASLVLDTQGVLILVNERSRQLFNLNSHDLGRPLQDLEISYRPVELRSWIEQVYEQRRRLTISDVEYQMAQGELIYLEVQITPLVDPLNTIQGITITFTDVTSYKRLQRELEHANQELEMAYEELQSSNEELETTNEELQSSNEELETTNEELQSTNEELETMNEELQSTNEELQTLNDELHRRSEELNQTNSFLESILTSLKGGVVVVDRNLKVLIWNRQSEDLWGLRSDEALGQNFLNLDIGLPVEQLRQPIRNSLGDQICNGFATLLDAINRRGKSIQCRVTCTPLVNLNQDIQG